MKYTSILFLLLPIHLFAQARLGQINDPDGYTNVRSEPSGQAGVIGQINDGEIFEFDASGASWYKVWTNYGLSGYMHSSKIQDVKLECGCNGYGGASSKPILRYTEAGRVLSICGAIDSVENKVIYGTEMLVQDCLNHEKLNEPSILPQKVELKDGRISMTELANLPVSKSWKYDLVPVTKNSYFFIDDRFIKQINAGAYSFPKFTTNELKEELKELKSGLPNGILHLFIDKALVLALNDCDDCETLFLSLGDYSVGGLDGENGEKYLEAVRIYKLNKK
ncbi:MULTISPECIES: SH3 domain-containing protein [unclassified Imperialibacter]|uniref:SH3 domain-containing protein n=1 Tax=unclassified Imperialibacter TaxID=2629706 RepID=UPI001252ADB6|nr:MULTISPECIES: SH3 domain-containing protein [unclassified Imperialibacter]CAD5250680.1 exported hypothetical protein [Imperialibacter sp. 75]CAD5286040.1 exported hypothetical protein [Imperialibacter sp. 89]VVT05220.1 exported hypothetical protein [Imperialibacter sp. EC-SDR9]